MEVNKLSFGYDLLLEGFTYDELKEFLTHKLPDDFPPKVCLEIRRI